MSAFSTFSANLVLTWLFSTAAATRPTTWYVSLHTGDPGTDGSANEVTTGLDANYVRKALTMGTAAAKQMLNSAQCSWTAAASITPYTITHVCIKDALTAGNTLFMAAKPVPTSVTNNAVTTFAVGEIIAALL